MIDYWFPVALVLIAFLGVWIALIVLHDAATVVPEREPDRKDPRCYEELTP